MEMAELRAWLRLKLTLGVGGDSAHRLLKAFGLPEQIFAAPQSALRQVVSERKAMALMREPDDFGAAMDTLLAWLDADANTGVNTGADRRVFSLADAQYPKALLSLADAPILIYTMGKLAPSDLDLGRAIAMVGSRNPTPQGLANARQFAKHFSDLGLSVVSGLASGIDAASHEGALQGAGTTVAVVGTGLDRVYPKQNHVLAHQIAGQGLIISEFELGTPPLANNFPRRNRIIAALSQGCLVVEAAMQSGSLITARLASEMGKEVFAIPGSIHSTQSHGCHHLIKQGAKLVESAQDVLEELSGVLGAARPAIPSNAAPSNAVRSDAKDLSDGPEDDYLLAAIGFDPVSLDSLQARTGLDTAALQAQLFALELENHITRLPGGLVQRLVIG